jgi:hypothetical protein
VARTVIHWHITYYLALCVVYLLLGTGRYEWLSGFLQPPYCSTSIRTVIVQTKASIAGWGGGRTYLNAFISTIQLSKKHPILLFHHRVFVAGILAGTTKPRDISMGLIFWVCHPETPLVLVKCEPMRMENYVAGCCGT